jgi:hypothetical protein
MIDAFREDYCRKMHRMGLVRIVCWIGDEIRVVGWIGIGFDQHRIGIYGWIWVVDCGLWIG